MIMSFHSTRPLRNKTRDLAFDFFVAAQKWGRAFRDVLKCLPLKKLEKLAKA